MIFSALKCDNCAKLIQLPAGVTHEKIEAIIPKDWFQLYDYEDGFLHFCSKDCIENYLIA